jgi:hypothetical protein
MYVEFLVVILPFMAFLTGLVQLSMLLSARLVVDRAAQTAARAAIVVLDDDPASYGGEQRNATAGGRGLGDERAIPALLNYLGAGAGAGSVGTGGSARMGAIRAAAAVPLLALAPEGAASNREASVGRSIGETVGLRALSSSAEYSRDALAVGIVPSTPPNQTVRVRVTYAFHCGIPLARMFMCQSAGNANSALAAGNGDGMLPGKGRYLVMSAEASLPNQAADYSYRGE